MFLRHKLLIQVVLSKSQHRHHISPVADRQLDETLPPLQHEFHGAGLSFERFPSSAYDDRDGAAHAFVVGTAGVEEVVAGFAGYGGETQSEGVVAVDWDSEIRVQRQQRIGDTRKQLVES